MLRNVQSGKRRRVRQPGMTSCGYRGKYPASCTIYRKLYSMMEACSGGGHRNDRKLASVCKNEKKEKSKEKEKTRKG